jgi:hypothetical protein
MCSFIRSSAFGLRTSVWTQSRDVVENLGGAIDGVGLLKFNDDHMTPPFAASNWGGPKRSGGPSGQSSHFCHATTKRQAIACNDLPVDALRGLLETLGCGHLLPQALNRRASDFESTTKSPPDRELARKLGEEAAAERYARLFREFIEAKRALGEATGHISEATFSSQLEALERAARERHGQEVRYWLDLHEGKIALRSIRV